MRELSRATWRQLGLGISVSTSISGFSFLAALIQGVRGKDFTASLVLGGVSLVAVIFLVGFVVVQMHLEAKAAKDITIVPFPVPANTDTADGAAA